MGRLLLCLGLLAFLSACGSGRPVAPERSVDAARYVSGDPPSITLFTSIKSQTGVGAHSAILINGSERVIFDPAGSFEATEEGRPVGPTRGDVIYGVSDPLLSAYRRFQSSTGYHMVAITVQVPPAVAEEALRKAEDHGWVSQAFCADASSSLLSSLPGFEALHPSLFPRAFMIEAEKLPGAVIRTYVNGQEVPNGSAGLPYTDAHHGPMSDFPDGIPG